jgi:hypothetical protein
MAIMFSVSNNQIQDVDKNSDATRLDLYHQVPEVAPVLYSTTQSTTKHSNGFRGNLAAQSQLEVCISQQ